MHSPRLPRRWARPPRAAPAPGTDAQASSPAFLPPPGQFRPSAGKSVPGAVPLPSPPGGPQPPQGDRLPPEVHFGGAPTPQPPSPVERVLAEQEIPVPISPSLEANLAWLKQAFGTASDLVVRRFRLGPRTGLFAAAVFLNHAVDMNTVNGLILKTAMEEPVHPETLPYGRQFNPVAFVQYLWEHMFPVAKGRVIARLDEARNAIPDGALVILLDGFVQGLVLEVQKWPKRQPTEPSGEAVIRGPHLGFVEDLSTNCALIRNRLRHADLRIEQLAIGRRSRTAVALVYIHGLTSPQLVAEARRRLSFIDTDVITDISLVEGFIQDAPYSVFPTLQSTERPDRLEFFLMEGRLAVLADGSPRALVAPSVFWDLFQSPEDAYHRFPYPSFMRALRLVAGLLSLFMPSLYVAIVTFHPEMIPTDLAMAIAASRAPLPLPAVAEAFLMELAMEMVREAGIRLPSPIGQTIGIVGAVVLGQAAVAARIVSPLMVIVVASTAIASFVVPSFNIVVGIRLLRFPLLLFSSTLGLYGLMVGFVAIVLHQVGLSSFGVPYMTPLAPQYASSARETILHTPSWRGSLRPRWLHPQERQRQAWFTRLWGQGDLNLLRRVRRNKAAPCAGPGPSPRNPDPEQPCG